MYQSESVNGGNINKIVPAMKASIFNLDSYSISGSFVELAELGVDSILDNDILKSIPVVKTILSVCNAGVFLRERNLIKQTWEFIQAFNNGKLSEEELLSHKKELEDPVKAEKEVGRVLLLLDRSIESIQAKALGSLYQNYVRKIISWEEFIELSEANSRMFVSDYECLRNISRNVITNNCDDTYEYQMSRLQSLGLVINHIGTVNGTTVSLDNSYQLTRLGKEFANAI